MFVIVNVLCMISVIIIIIIIMHNLGSLGCNEKLKLCSTMKADKMVEL